MKKQIFAALMVLMLILSGCSTVGTVPDELAMETEVTASEEAENSLFPSESMELAAPEETKKTETPETENAVPPKEESKPEERTPAVTAPDEDESVPAAVPPVTPAEREAPKEIPKPAETQPEPIPQQPAPEETKPKTAYDYPFDIETIKADCIAIGQGMGLNLDSSLTPSNAASWNPVTASQNTQGAALKQSLASYIQFHTVENLGSYGIDSITSFNIYCEPRGNGVYSIYFLFA